MKYKKKPVVIDAIQFNGENYVECRDFMNANPFHTCMSKSQIIIDTLEGEMIVSKGDFIIKGVNGEFYPCKPDIFAKTYTLVDENTPNVGYHIGQAINVLLEGRTFYEGYFDDYDKLSRTDKAASHLFKALKGL